MPEGAASRPKHCADRGRFTCVLECDPNACLLVVLGLLLVVLLVVLLLTLRLENGSRDPVEISLAILADPASSSRILLQDTNLLQRLDDLSLDRTGCVAVVGRARASVDASSVQFLQGSDTDVLSEVDVTGDGGCSVRVSGVR